MLLELIKSYYGSSIRESLNKIIEYKHYFCVQNLRNKY
jgi:hypothetical protein